MVRRLVFFILVPLVVFANTVGCGYLTDSLWIGSSSIATAPLSIDDKVWGATDKTPIITWAASSPAPSYYQLAIGTTSGGTDTLTWVNVGNVTSYQLTGLSLTAGTVYYASVRAVTSEQTSPPAKGDGFTVDASPPSAPTSFNDKLFWNSLTDTATMTWVASATTGAPIENYQLAIGTTSGATNVLNWTNIGDVTSYQKTGLTLSNETRYFASLRAVDAAGNVSAVTNGDGWDARTNVTTNLEWVQQAYIKASNADAGDWFSSIGAVAVSGDTIVVGSGYEDSNQTTITNGTTSSSDNSLADSGAVYVYKRSGTTWAQEAYIKAVNANASDLFGSTVSISGDTLVVGASRESSNLTTITNGATASSDNSASNSGAAYVYKRSGTTWAQEAYLKASNAEANDQFGMRVSIFGDTIAVGAVAESSSQTTITNGATSSADNSTMISGAVYIYKRAGSTWTQEAYVKASNPDVIDSFGSALSLSGDTLAVGVYSEDSNQSTITNGTTASSNNSFFNSGAVYVYKRTGVNWAQEAYVKPGNMGSLDQFGISVSLFGDTLAVGAYGEDSNQTTITNGTASSADNSSANSGAAFVYKRTGVIWAQEAYIKSSNSDVDDQFGVSVSLSGDTLAVGSYKECSNQSTITNGATASTDNSVFDAGAAYVYKRTGNSWAQEAYIKASNVETGDKFGYNTALDRDTLVVGTYLEDSNQTTITNGTTSSSNNSAADSGAVYVYVRQAVGDMNQDSINERLGAHQQAYIKAVNSDSTDQFGKDVDIDGDTVVVGSPNESSNQNTITNGTSASSDNSTTWSGAAYIYKRSGTSWTQEAYIKPINVGSINYFGTAVAVSGDTVVVTSKGERSNQTTITNGLGASSDTSAFNAGAAYVYTRNGATWTQQAYIKASNGEANDEFGYDVDIEGNTLIVSSIQEASSQTTITNGATASADNSIAGAGAIYVYKRSGTTWAQEAYIKASNAEAGDWFGSSVSLSGDSLAVGAVLEDSNQTTITNGGGSSANNSAGSAGAVYIYKRTGTTWAQEAYIKSTNIETNDYFGGSVSLDTDTLVVGAYGEDSNQTSVTNGGTASSDNSALTSGAAYIYKRTGTVWSQEAYLKPSNNIAGNRFGGKVTVSGDLAAVGAIGESSNLTTISTGITASTNVSNPYAGAVYIYRRSGSTWVEQNYLKASNGTGGGGYFGADFKMNGEDLVVGCFQESVNSTSIINGSASAPLISTSTFSGAAYIYKLQSP